MTVGEECPECGKRLRKDGACSCGWMPSGETEPGCNRCNSSRREHKLHASWISLDHCSRCGDHSLNTAIFRRDTPNVDDAGARLCPDCAIAAFQRRMGDTNLDTKGPDGRTVREYIAACKAFEAKIVKRSRKAMAEPPVYTRDEETMRRAESELRRFQEHQLRG